MTIHRRTKPLSGTAVGIPDSYWSYINALRSSGMSAKARQVCAELASHKAQRVTGKWCSNLAEHTGLSSDSVTRAKGEAVAAGWLVLISSGRGGNSDRVDTFDLSIPVMQGSKPQGAVLDFNRNKEAKPQGAVLQSRKLAESKPQGADTKKLLEKPIDEHHHGLGSRPEGEIPNCGQAHEHDDGDDSPSTPSQPRDDLGHDDGAEAQDRAPDADGGEAMDSDDLADLAKLLGVSVRELNGKVLQRRLDELEAEYPDVDSHSAMVSAAVASRRKDNPPGFFFSILSQAFAAVVQREAEAAQREAAQEEAAQRRERKAEEQQEREAKLNKLAGAQRREQKEQERQQQAKTDIEQLIPRFAAVHYPGQPQEEAERLAREEISSRFTGSFSTDAEVLTRMHFYINRATARAQWRCQIL